MSATTIIDCNASWSDQITGILNHYIATSCVIYDLRPRSMENTRAWIEQRLASNLPVKGLVDAEGKLLGFGSFVVFRPFEAYQTTVEHSIYIHPDSHSKGYGRQLLELLLQTAVNQKRHCMIGGIDSSNLASIRLHERYGFTKCAEIRQVARKFDRWLDLHFYQKILD